MAEDEPVSNFTFFFGGEPQDFPGLLIFLTQYLIQTLSATMEFQTVFGTNRLKKENNGRLAGALVTTRKNKNFVLFIYSNY